MRKKTVLILFSLLILLSCKKSLLPFETPAVYYRTSCKCVGDLRLFAKSGEVTDLAVIDYWKNRLTDLSKDKIENQYCIGRITYPTDTIKLYDEMNANMRYEARFGGHLSDFSVRRENNLLVFTDNISFYTELQQDLNELPPYRQFLYKVLLDNKRPSPNPGYFYFDRTIQYYADITSEGLVMPMMASAYKATLNGTTSYGPGINNRLNPVGYTFLPATDTFAFQEFNMLFVK